MWILDLLEAPAPNQDVDGNGVLDHQRKVLKRQIEVVSARLVREW